MKCEACGRSMFGKYIPETGETMFFCLPCNRTCYVGGPDIEDDLEYGL